MKKILFLLFILVSCSKSETKIILTCGFEENPDGKRFGIELNDNDDLYYCIETDGGSGNYNYYYKKLEENEFNEINNLITRDFKNKAISDKVNEDARMYHFIVNSEKVKIDSIFVLSSLDSNQFVVIKKIIDLKSSNGMKKIDFHQFSSELLAHKLPVPPIGIPHK